MLSNDDITSLDALRDLDTEDEDERLDTQGTYRFLVSSTFTIRAESDELAFERLVSEHLEDEEDPALERREIELIDEE